MELRFEIGKDTIRYVRSDGAEYLSRLELSDLAIRQLAISSRLLALGS